MDSTKARKSRSAESYGACPIKRVRRTRDQITALRSELYRIVSEYQPATCRAFYQAVSRGLIDKAEKGYKLICHNLLIMRRAGELPYDWIADNTRWMRKPDTYSGLGRALHYLQRSYRRSIWDDQDCYVEIWTEKDALAGVLIDVTAKWDVPLMVAKGFSSESFLYSAAETIKAQDKPSFLYYFGDLDPSGVLIDRSIERNLRRLAPDADITFQRVAVTREQVDFYDLPTRPTKKAGNTHAKSFTGRSVEVDAINPNELRHLAAGCILDHLDRDAYDRMLVVEEAERETLQGIVNSLEGAA